MEPKLNLRRWARLPGEYHGRRPSDHWSHPTGACGRALLRTQNHARTVRFSNLRRARRRMSRANRSIAASLCLLSLLMFFVPSSGAVSGPRPGRLIPVAGAQSVVFGPGQFWVTTLRSLVRIDPVRHTVVARTRFPSYVASAVVDGRFVWVLTGPRSNCPSLLYSVSIATGRIVSCPPFPSSRARGPHHRCGRVALGHEPRPRGLRAISSASIQVAQGRRCHSHPE